MIELKLTYSTGTEACNLPTEWQDITFEKYLDLVNGDNGDWFRRISILTGISEENVRQVNIDTFSLMLSSVSFVSKMREFLEGEFTKPIEPSFANIQISQMEADNYFQVQMELDRVRKLGMDKMNAAPKMIEICTRKRNKDGVLQTGWDVMQEPCTNVLHIANFFLSKSGHFTTDGPG